MNPSTMDRAELARKIANCATLHGTFTLRSGAVSSVYFDKYRFEARPDILREIAAHMASLVPAGHDALAGLEMGGIPLAVMLSQQTGLPTLFVRKAAKTYGTCNLAEGGDLKGRTLCVVEDVITSGGQVIESVGLLREQGAEIRDVVCVIDRQSGGREALQAAGLRMHALFTRSELESAN